MKKIFRLFFVIWIIMILNINTTAYGEVPVTSSNNSTISGKVVDNLTGEALTGVAISIKEINITVYSDLDGNFVVSNIKPGKYDIVLYLLSYKKSLIENFEIDSNENEIIIVKMNIIK